MALGRSVPRLAGVRLRAALGIRPTCADALPPRRWPRAAGVRGRAATAALSVEQAPGSGPAGGAGAAQAVSSSEVAAEVGAAHTAGSAEAAAEVSDEIEIPPEVAELFDTLRGEALRRLDEFGPIHLFSLCWAYSTARLLDEDLQRRITDAALRLGEARDEKSLAQGKKRQATLPTSGASNGAGEASLDSERRSVPESPHVAAEGKHWMALYKPPYWQVSVDAKEATKAAERNAAVAPFADDDDGDGDAGDAAPAVFQSKKLRLDSWVRQTFGATHAIYGDAIEAHGLLHRLDAQTSGLIMCAKSYVGAYWLRLQWCSYLVDKEYVCLVHGWVPRNVREIHKRIRVDKKKAPNSRRTVSTICTVGANGKPSFTEVYTLSHLARPALGQAERYSLVVVKLHTGRTHQIRVHMQSIGHPLVTDSKYAQNQHAEDLAWCPRNFLHTYHIGFDDVPAESGADGAIGGEPVELFCPLPEDLRTVLSTLRPVDGASARPLADWLSGDSERLRLFAEYAPREEAP